MPNKHLLRSWLLATGIVLVSGCASHTASRESVDERYFEREARHYLKFQHEGRTVYCQNNKAVTSSVPYKECIWEDALRERVAEHRRLRNAVAYTKW